MLARRSNAPSCVALLLTDVFNIPAEAFRIAADAAVLCFLHQLSALLLLPLGANLEGVDLGLKLVQVNDEHSSNCIRSGRHVRSVNASTLSSESASVNLRSLLHVSRIVQSWQAPGHEAQAAAAGDCQCYCSCRAATEAAKYLSEEMMVADRRIK